MPLPARAPTRHPPRSCSTLSESPLQLLLSRSGFSLGRLRFGPRAVAPKVSSNPVWKGPPPTFTVPMDLDAEAARSAPLQHRCFLVVRDDAPQLARALARAASPFPYVATGRARPAPSCVPPQVLADAGRTVTLDLSSSAAASGPDFNDLNCTHFQAVASPAGGAEVTPEAAAAGAWEPRGPQRVLLLSSATNAAMLAPYHRSLRNHRHVAPRRAAPRRALSGAPYAWRSRREYARHHGYGFTLSLVPKRALGARSGKMAKHYALGVHAAAAAWDVICHVDLDAWRARPPLNTAAPTYLNLQPYVYLSC